MLVPPSYPEGSTDVSVCCLCPFSGFTSQSLQPWEEGTSHFIYYSIPNLSFKNTWPAQVGLSMASEALLLRSVPAERLGPCKSCRRQFFKISGLTLGLPTPTSFAWWPFWWGLFMRLNPKQGWNQTPWSKNQPWTIELHLNFYGWIVVIEFETVAILEGHHLYRENLGFRYLRVLSISEPNVSQNLATCAH